MTTLTAPAPSACQRCHGTGWTIGGRPCPDCTCLCCEGSLDNSAQIGGLCVECIDEGYIAEPAPVPDVVLDADTDRAYQRAVDR